MAKGYEPQRLKKHSSAVQDSHTFASQNRGRHARNSFGPFEIIDARLRGCLNIPGANAMHERLKAGAASLSF